MISPLNIATQGLLDSPLAVAAVRGHLIIGVVVPPTIPGGGGGGKKGGLQHPREYTYTPKKVDLLRAQLLNEDDEILAIIMAAIDTLQ